MDHTAEKINVFPKGGVLGYALGFITRNQLMRRDLWRTFVSVFRDCPDSGNGGWRGEYFGKMMRGGCFTYRLTGDEALYEVLTEAVTDILTTQRPDGTISSYRPDRDLFGWDVWCRKYVLLGLYYYYEICRDAALRSRILDSAILQLEAFMRRVGPAKEGKIPITDTSDSWQGLNSSTILEPVMLYYRLTGDGRLLTLADHVVGCGGIAGGDLFALAHEDRIAPYRYPVTKAYEMISCMEGLLEYAEATGRTEARETVIRFADRVLETDFTVIGSGGTTHELFDHSTWRQSSAGVCEIAQETCVTVTMMKFFSRLYRETGDGRFADAVERSFYNAYLGALNTRKQIEPRLLHREGTVPEALPFDSYSPLTAGRRGRQIGGFMTLPGGRYYGCCACIGSLGAAVMGLNAVRMEGNRFEVTFLLPGTAEFTCPDGTHVTMDIETGYPYCETAVLRFRQVAREGRETGAQLQLAVRIPGQSRGVELGFEGAGTVCREPGAAVLEGVFRAGDAVSIRCKLAVEVQKPVIFGSETVRDDVFTQDPDAARRICLTRGPLVLAPVLKEDANGREIPLAAAAFTGERLRNARFSVGDPASFGSGTSMLRMTLDGPEGYEFFDYASLGKDWNAAPFAAWFLTDGAL